MAYNNYFNPYQNNSQNIDMLYNQLAQLKQQQMQMQSPMPNQQVQNNGVLQIGTYVVVKTLQDMENYGVNMDGTPVNIFIENSGVFYSKKIDKGIVTCQPFSFAPLNATKSSENKEVNENIQDAPEWAINLLDRVTALENNLKPRQTRKQKANLGGDEDVV